MKLRNRLIALVCLIIFLGLGATLFLTNSSRKPFAIILFLGDNITPSTLTAARIFSGGGDARLQMEDFPNTALCRNAANDFSVPESASASTAVAAGKRVNRGSLCIDPQGTKLPSILEIASTKGRSTGLVTTGPITGITTAAYYAKTLNSDDEDDLAGQFYRHSPFSLVVGGEPELKQFSTSSSNNPLSLLANSGVVVLKSVSELEDQPFWKNAPLLGLLPQSQLSLTHPGEGDPNAPSISDVVRVAIRHLQSNRSGYLLVVDDPGIGQAATNNDAESMFSRLLAFDQAVATARRYAGDKALIVIAGRQSLGGLQLNGYPFLGDKGVAVLSMNAQGNPWLCWSTGPGFGMETTSDFTHVKKGKTNSPGILSQPSADTLPEGLGVASDVLVLGVGPGSEKLKGFLDLTDVNHLILGEL